MYNQISGNTLYLMFYAGVTVLNLMACCYLLFRRGNAIAPDVTSPARLRHWTAAFLGACALSHLTKDVLTCPVTEIHEAKPAATYFEGKQVFSM